VSDPGSRPARYRRDREAKSAGSGRSDEGFSGAAPRGGLGSGELLGGFGCGLEKLCDFVTHLFSPALFVVNGCWRLCRSYQLVCAGLDVDWVFRQGRASGPHAGEAAVARSAATAPGKALLQSRRSSGAEPPGLASQCALRRAAHQRQIFDRDVRRPAWILRGIDAPGRAESAGSGRSGEGFSGAAPR
jgi:hypothetical protein